jgi:hypothetical protein
MPPQASLALDWRVLPVAFLIDGFCDKLERPKAKKGAHVKRFALDRNRGMWCVSTMVCQIHHALLGPVGMARPRPAVKTAWLWHSALFNKKFQVK